MDQGMRIWNERRHLERNWQVLDAVRQVAASRGASMSRVAIA
jgi:aryl-alcohol dehydrogenase-like predicted oxidoreductase